MSLLLRPMLALARGPCRWAVALLLITASPFASVQTGATGTVFTATTVAALIADITTANAQPSQGPYTINLTAGGVYTLVTETATGSGIGLPIIVSGVDVTINGNGAAIQRSAAVGTPDFRLFMVNANATLRLNALTLRNGSAVGAAGANGPPGSPGTIGNNAFGGALLNSGMLFISGSTFTNNHATSGQGGQGGNGHDNSGTPGGAGGVGGDAGNAGGGAIDNLGTLVVAASAFSGNTALGGNGGDGGNGGNGTGSPGGKGGNGGKGGTGTGGALANSGTAIVTNSTFTGNGATGGAGGDGGSPGTGSGGSTIGFFGQGGAGQGGAMLDTISGALTVTNSTITANSAAGGSGGSGFGGSGGIGSGSGGGLRTPGGSVTVKNTILASNTAPDDGNCGGSLTDGGYNLEFTQITCGFRDHPQSNSPILGALTNHGGTTQTMAIGVGSAALNNGNPTVCAGTGGVAPVGGVDQRGLPRPMLCSIGAFEPQPAPFPTLDALSPSSGSITGGSSMTLTGAGFANGATVLFGAASGISPGVIGGTMITVTAPGHAAGVVDVTVTNPDGQAATLILAYTFGTVMPLPGPRPTAPPSVSTPRPLPDVSRSTGAPSLVGTPNPLPPHR